MFKSTATAKCVIEGKEYFLICDNDSPLPHLKEALFQFQKYVGLLEDNARKASEPANPIEPEVVEKTE